MKEKELEKYKKFGEPDDLAGKISHWENLEKEKAGTDPKEVDRIVQRTVAEKMKEVSKTIEEKDRELSKAQQRLHEIEVIEAAASEAQEFIKPSLLPFVKETHFKKYLKKDEQGNIIVIDDSGKPQYRNDGKLKGVKDLLSELIVKHPDLEKGKPSNHKSQSGSMSQSNNGAGSLVGVTDKAERIKILRSASSFNKR